MCNQIATKYDKRTHNKQYISIKFCLPFANCGEMSNKRYKTAEKTIRTEFQT